MHEIYLHLHIFKKTQALNFVHVPLLQTIHRHSSPSIRSPLCHIAFVPVLEAATFITHPYRRPYMHQPLTARARGAAPGATPHHATDWPRTGLLHVAKGGFSFFPAFSFDAAALPPAHGCGSWANPRRICTCCLFSRLGGSQGDPQMFLFFFPVLR